MSDLDPPRAKRLQAIMTALMERSLADSLSVVHRAITRWQNKELGVFETHAAILRHAAQSERLADRMARVGMDNAHALLREAFEMGLIERDEFEVLVGRAPEQVALEADFASGRGLSEKRRVVERLLALGPVLLHVDGSHANLRIPEQFRSDQRLVLRFGYDLTPAIIDLSLDDDEVAGTLTFGGVPHRCVLPWAAVYAAVSEGDGKGMVWPENVPPAVANSFSEVTEAGDKSDEDVEKEGIHLAPAPRAEPPETRNPGRHLKLVK